MATAKQKTKKPSKPARRAKDDASGLTKPEAKQALAAATKAIRALKKQADKNFWQIGRRLNAVAELELHKAVGLASIADYAETLDLSRTTAFAYMRVAEAFGEEVASTFGAAKLDKALGYIAATPEEETAHDVPKLRVRVVGADGQVHEKPFAETTTRELTAAAAHEKGEHPPKGKKKRKPAVSAAVLARVAQANRRLDRAVGKSNAARADVTVRTHDREALLDVRGVPLGAIVKALGAGATAFD
jgi:hypothetical protein